MNSRLDNIKDPEEKAFLKQFINYSQKIKQTYRSYYTDFYNKQWMSELIRRYIGTLDEEYCRFFGGYENAERQLLGFFPSKDYPFEFPVGCIKIIVKTGIGKPLTHRDFLGALMGLGIKRDMIGDIIVTNFGAYIILHNNVMDYVLWNLNGIGRYQNIEVKIDEEVLQNIASQTGGKYFRATDNQKLRDIYKEIDSLEKTELEVKTYSQPREEFTLILMIAMLIFVVDVESIYTIKLTWIHK